MSDQENQNPGNQHFDQGSTPNDPTQVHNLSDLNPVDPEATAEQPAVPQDATTAIPAVDPNVPPSVQPAADPYAAGQVAGAQTPAGQGYTQPGYNQPGYQTPPPVDGDKKNLTALWIVLAVVAAIAIGLGAAALFSSNKNTPTPVIETKTVTPTLDPTTPTFDPTTPTFDPTTPTVNPTTPTNSPVRNSGNGQTPVQNESGAGAGSQGFDQGGRANSAP